ncbi:MAG: PorP/SprF family type IX secretion system membrane protein [Acidobacterium ailaaui]|nr:PorP/SprF family type IX secretion system membrane protein [Pseudacidobacterium ailaaui]
MKRFLLFIFCLYQLSAFGQHSFSNAVSEYYQNAYLWNPAMAGANHTKFYALFNNSWWGFEGSARLIDFSFDMPFAKKMGAGIMLSSFSSGVFDQYTGSLSYAYQIEWSEENRLRLGGSLSFYKAHLDTKELSNNGEMDPIISTFNEKSLQLDGGLGAYLQLHAFSIGLSGYNLSNYFQRANQQKSNWEIGQLQASYQFSIQENKFSLQPLIAYQIFHATKNIFMGAIQFTYPALFDASIYWQSTGSIMGGLGLILNPDLEINFFYTSKNKYGYQEQYEAGIKYMLNP